MEALQVEYPTVGFTRITVGECPGSEELAITEFADGWDPDLAAELYPTWVARNLVTGALLEVEDLVRVVDHVLRGGAERVDAHGGGGGETSGLNGPSAQSYSSSTGMPTMYAMLL